MALKGAGFERKSKASDEIPSSSLADIAFLLLIFFMVTTVFRQETDRQIEWPQAEATQQIDEQRDNILNIWVERNGDLWVNDRPIAMESVADLVGPLWLESGQRLIISIRADSQAPYRFVDSLQEQLKRSGAVYVVFATEMERSLTRERR
ncbi:MAG: biopolymer transporter ExbD [Gemmatimonadota bacterium]